MKNRVVVLLVSGLLVFSMIGCGSDAKQAQSSDVVVETETQLAENEIEEIEVESTEIENTEVIDYSDIDYADTLVEIEGGDGTEVAVEETIESAFDFTIVACDPVTKYTNRGSNIRSLPTKDSELLFSVNTNTSVTVTGTTEDGSWSRVEHGGLVCYIKSSLLSDTKTSKPASGSGSSSSSGSSQTSDSSGGTSSSDSSSGSSSSGSSQSNQDVKDLAESLFGESTNGGTGGYDGGSTGNTGPDNLGGGH